MIEFRQPVYHYLTRRPGQTLRIYHPVAPLARDTCQTQTANRL